MLGRFMLGVAAGAAAEKLQEKVVSEETRKRFRAVGRKARRAFASLGADVQRTGVQVGAFVDQKVQEFDDWVVGQDLPPRRPDRKDRNGQAGHDPKN